MNARALFAAALACVALAAHASPALRLEDPRATPALRLAPLDAESAKRVRDALAPNQTGISRRGDVEAQAGLGSSRLQWQRADGGYAAHFSVVSAGAAGLRVGLRFAAMPDGLEMRVAQRGGEGALSVVDVARGAQIRKLARGRFPLDHWTASTDGEEQVIELWLPQAPRPREIDFTVFDVSHLFQRVLEPVMPKVTYQCHVDVSCASNPNAMLDAPAVARMHFVAGGSSFACTGSLLADRSASGTPLFTTANHCIHTQAAASTLETFWFYYPATCGAATQPPTRLTGGAVLLMANLDADFALMRLGATPPPGARFLSWDPAPLSPGQPIFGLHHPDAEYQRYSAGNFLGTAHVTDSDTNVRFADPFNIVLLTEGIVEGGSSGSPLLTAPDVFHGTLFGSPDDNACGRSDNTAAYSDFASAYPLVSSFLAGPDAGDDHGDSAAAATTLAPDAKLVAQINNTSDSDWFRFTFDVPGMWTISSFSAVADAAVDVRGEIYAADGSTLLDFNDDASSTDFNFRMTRAIASPGTYYVRVSSAPGNTGSYGLLSSFQRPDDYADSAAAAAPLALNGTVSGLLGTTTDQDWFRITVDTPGIFHAGTTGSTDTMGRLFASDTVTVLADSDDEISPDTNFGFAVYIAAPGTYYLRVTGFDGETGPYTLVTAFTPAPDATNYTDLWWASPAGSESGWGVNLNHQSGTIFATLFSYGADGRDTWVVASNLTRDAQGRFTGTLYRTTGPSFDSPAWSAVNVTAVGTMTLAFSGPNLGTLTYSIDGVAVTKSIVRQVFATPPTCTFTTSTRDASHNFQDLWWNPAESGWGINLTQQGALMFATLFTYAPDNRAMWLVASSLARQADGSFSGDLFRTTGPPFNASPWTAINVTKVGTMSLAFTTGARGTLTYSYNGATITKPIQRQTFGTMPTLCH